MLTKLIGRLYEACLEVSLWFLLALGLIIGAQAGGFLGALLGVVSAAVFGVVFLGAFILIVDIRRSVTRIEVAVAGQETSVSVTKQKSPADKASSEKSPADKASSEGWM